MAPEWGSLPLLPLRCILDHLSLEDAVAAMSTCRHWRNAVLLYEGRKESLRLTTKNLERSIFLTRLFKKHTRHLQINIDCNEAELDKFMNFVLPQFFDTVKLQELIFVGQSYLLQNTLVPFVKLKRILTESLMFKHLDCLEKVALMGCVMGPKNENDRYIHKNVEYYSRPLEFSSVQGPAEVLFSSANTDHMLYSALKHVILDYEQISTASLEPLVEMSNLTHLTLNITNRREPLPRVDWFRLRLACANALNVEIVIIAVPYKRFDDIIDNVLVEGLELTSLKVMFCKTFCASLISHVAHLYKSSLTTLLWVDAPLESPESFHNIVRPLRHQQPDVYAHVNPFVLLCWQCTKLRRLVIHGYWIWQYDILGFVRLRSNLSQLEVSAIASQQERLHSMEITVDEAVPVRATDTEPNVGRHFVQEVNEYTEFKWSPTPWAALPRALRPRASPAARRAYIAREVGASLPPHSDCD